MKYAGIILMLLLSARCVFAQQAAMNQCKDSKIGAYIRSAAKTTVADLAENNYDVKHIHIDVSVSNQSVAISGKVTTTAEVVALEMDTYVFELNQKLAIDSVIIDGQKLSFTRQDDIVRVALPAFLFLGNIFKATVYYSGVPDAGSVFFFQSGMNNAENERNGSKLTYTLSEPYRAKDWWPCKQSLRDKVDSADIWITVPDSLKAGSNGVLQNITLLPGNMSRYEWKTNYPTAYYLFSLAVGNYTEYTYNVTLQGGKQFPVQNYIYNVPGELDEQKAGMDSTGMMLQYFSELFGDYPFYNEKYGHCMTPVFGGMEHQTMTTIRHFGTPLVSHELAHQWFGNNVTCATWQDIWLNEGMASYCEYLFGEKFWHPEIAAAYMQRVHNIVLNDTNVGGSIYVPAVDTLNPYRVFDGRLSYSKASAVLHMLRFVINNDDVFFNILQQYNQNFAFGNATTNDFIQLAQGVSGVNLNPFFKEWIFGEGYPTYNIKWNQVDDNIYLKVEQSTSVPNSVPFFSTPYEIELQTNSGSDIRRLELRNNIQEYVIPANEEVQGLLFDPKNWLLNKQEIVRDYSYGLEAVPSGAIIVRPNPTNERWIVQGVTPGMQLYLYDLNGQIVRVVPVEEYGAEIYATGLSRGVYILKVLNGKEEVRTIKLVKI